MRQKKEMEPKVIAIKEKLLETVLKVLLF